MTRRRYLFCQKKKTLPKNAVSKTDYISQAVTRKSFLSSPSRRRTHTGRHFFMRATRYTLTTCAGLLNINIHENSQAGRPCNPSENSRAAARSFLLRRRSRIGGTMMSKWYFHRYRKNVGGAPVCSATSRVHPHKQHVRRVR